MLYRGPIPITYAIFPTIAHLCVGYVFVSQRIDIAAYK